MGPPALVVAYYDRIFRRLSKYPFVDDLLLAGDKIALLVPANVKSRLIVHLLGAIIVSESHVSSSAVAFVVSSVPPRAYRRALPPHP